MFLNELENLIYRYVNPYAMVILKGSNTVYKTAGPGRPDPAEIEINMISLQRRYGFLGRIVAPYAVACTHAVLILYTRCNGRMIKAQSRHLL